MIFLTVFFQVKSFAGYFFSQIWAYTIFFSRYILNSINKHNHFIVSLALWYVKLRSTGVTIPID